VIEIDWNDVEAVAGYAVGCVGLDYHTFYFLTPVEFFKIMNGYNIRRQQELNNSWEQVRFMTANIMNPHLKRPIKPADLIKLPSDRTKITWNEEELEQIDWTKFDNNGQQ
jgi:hypothetical protein